MKSRALFLSAAFAALLLSVQLLLIPISQADAASNTYPWGQCTWYAKSRRPDIPNHLGNARYWASGARALGFPVDAKPRVGDVAVFQPYVQGNSPYGHVGYVSKVSGSSFLLVSMWGNEHNGKIHAAWHYVAKGVSFIHYKAKKK